MAAYQKIVLNILGTLTSWSIKNIARSANHWADALSRLTTSTATQSQDPIYIKELAQASTTREEVNLTSTTPDWRSPFIDFIKGTLETQDKNEKRKIEFKARNFCLINDMLYRRALTEPLLKCVGPEEALTAMIEIQSGICGEHASGKNMALK